MGRKEVKQHLQVKVPSFFKCPISLDVMRSPVSLCTGVTYDRSSIQRWLESGNNTCPATMQVLPTKDFVPNHTLHRLIQLWSSSGQPKDTHTSPLPLSHHLAHDLLHDLRSSADPLPPLQKLADFFSDDDSDKNNLIGTGDCIPNLTSLLREGARLETQEATIRVLSLILTVDSIDRGHKETLISSLVSDLDDSVSSIVSILKDGSSLRSRMDSATVLESMISSSNQESKLLIAEKPGLLHELIRLISPAAFGNAEKDRKAIDAGLSCLIGLSTARRVRAQIVRLGIVPALTRLLSQEAAAVPAAAAEKALRLLEAAARCGEGRAAICEEAEACVGAILGRMMKVGQEGTEAGVMVLWSVCHVFRNRRAQEAVTGSNGGSSNKILLLMQSNCSPAVRQMAGDLLRMFRVNSKSCLAGYDTKTTHIMPF